MAYSIIPHRVQRLGFCCPYAYFFSTRKQSHATVALELQCSKISVRKWRKKTLLCLGYGFSACFVNVKLDQRPVKSPSVSADTDHVLDAAQLSFPGGRTGSVPCRKVAKPDSEPPC